MASEGKIWASKGIETARPPKERRKCRLLRADPQQNWAGASLPNGPDSGSNGFPGAASSYSTGAVWELGAQVDLCL